MTIESRNDQSDGQLIARVRGGDGRAFDELYRRHHTVATGVAHNILDNSSDVEDVVADSFAYLFSKLKEGQGPDSFFRGYLLTIVRRKSYTSNKASNKTMLPEKNGILDRPVIDSDRLVEEFESEAIVRAFSGLPERWQSVLWYLDVEQESTRTVAQRMGMTTNSVSALVMRARDALRTHYLQQYVVPEQNPECRPYVAKLAKYATKTLSLPVRVKVEHHLDVCEHCTAVLATLRDSAPTLRAALLPAIAGISWVAYQGASTKAVTGTRDGSSLGHNVNGHRPRGNGPSERLRNQPSRLRTSLGAATLAAVGVIVVAMLIPVFLAAATSPTQPSAVPSSISQSELSNEGDHLEASGLESSLAARRGSHSRKTATPQAVKNPDASSLTPITLADQPSTLIEASAEPPGHGTAPRLGEATPPDVAGSSASSGAGLPVVTHAPATPTNPSASPNPSSTPSPTSSATGSPTAENPVATSSTVTQEMSAGIRNLVSTVVFPKGVTVNSAQVTFQLNAFAVFVVDQAKTPVGWICTRGDLHHYTCTAAQAKGTVTFEQFVSYPDLTNSPALTVTVTAVNLQPLKSETTI